MSDYDYEHVLISSECVLEKAWKFLETRFEYLKATDEDQRDCSALITELKDCLEMLEALHGEYQSKIEQSQNYQRGFETYAQSLSLTQTQMRGDISNVK